MTRWLTDGGSWDEGRFTPHGPLPPSGDPDPDCPECGDAVELHESEGRCRDCRRLWRLDAAGGLTEIPERPWNPNDRGYEPPRGSK